MLVPAAVVPIEHDLLLNPEHARIGELDVLREEDFRFDPRLWAA